MTTPLQRYDATRDALLSKSADGLGSVRPVAYWSIVQPGEKRRRVPWRRRVWRWLLRRVVW
jgi:hypothetical protein